MYKLTLNQVCLSDFSKLDRNKSPRSISFNVLNSTMQEVMAPSQMNLYAILLVVVLLLPVVMAARGMYACINDHAWI
jgi:hypothetical protein